MGFADVDDVVAGFIDDGAVTAAVITVDLQFIGQRLDVHRCDDISEMHVPDAEIRRHDAGRIPKNDPAGKPAVRDPFRPVGHPPEHPSVCPDDGASAHRRQDLAGSSDVCRSGSRSLCDHLDHDVDRLADPEKRYHRGSAERRWLLRRPQRQPRIHPSEIQAQPPAAQC